MSVFTWRRTKSQAGHGDTQMGEELFSNLESGVPSDLLAKQAWEVERLLRDHPVSRRVGRAHFDQDLGSLELTLVGDMAPQGLDEGSRAWSARVILATADAVPARQIVAMVGLGETRVSFRGLGSHLFVTAHCERWVYSLVGHPALEGSGRV